MIVCKNCGGRFDDSLTKCPYCGTMHKAGAYRSFRKRIADMIDSFLGLKEEAEHSVSRNILFSLLKALLAVVVIVGLAFLASRMMNTNYYNDREYDEERLEKILWTEENIDKLNDAFAKGDLDTISSLQYDNTSAFYQWEHYDAYCLLEAYARIGDHAFKDEYYLRDCLYFLYCPDYYGDPTKMSEEDYAVYEENRKVILNDLIELGYSESELRSIYDRCADSYGYLNASDLKKYVKGENNG